MIKLTSDLHPLKRCYCHSLIYHISRAFATNKEGAVYFDARKRSCHARRGLKISKRAQQQQIVVREGTKARGSAEGKGGFPRAAAAEVK